MGSRSFGRFGLILAATFLPPASAFAQSSIAGRVSDTTGGVLPGVTVEAASPALIERVRVVATDSDGRYTITDLRPGLYSVTFTLPGFSTVRREGITVSADVTVTVNVELTVGAVEETITVSGAAPVVDVQRSARTEVVPREVMDIVPTGRDFKAVAATIPSIKTNNQNVGGTRTVTQQGISVHGLPRNNTTSYVDGLNTNTSWSEGGVQMYHNDAMAEEVSYATSSAAADVSAGGVRINVIARDGGDTFTGAGFAGHIPAQWQSNNVDQGLIDRGIRGRDRIELISDVNASAGGPVVRDRLWFFLSFRRISMDVTKPNAFHADGRPGHEVNLNYNYSGRLTGQVSPTNKVTAYFDRVIKKADQVLTSGTDPDTAAGMRYPSLYYVGQAKWTSTVSSRLLFETGLSIPVMTARIGYKPEQRKVPFTAEWYAGARRQDIVLGTARTAYSSDGGNYYYRYHVSSSLSYVTGSHNFKTGVQLSRGRHTDTRDYTAHLIQRYRNGVPDSVQVFNAPVIATNLLKGDLGVYAMDTWTLGRLTVNPGIRFEWFDGAIGASNVTEGRFVPARSFPEVPHMPDWFDVTPRLSVAYDLFGDARTALKASVNRFMEAHVTSVAARYNPMVNTPDIRNWRDLNGDDIAQNNEIGPSNNIYFGTRPSRKPADDLRREYNLEYSVGIQRELFPRVAVTGGWYRRTFHNLVRIDNLLVDVTDYVPFDVLNPLTGETFAAYNLKREKQGLINLLDTNSQDRNKRSRTYDGTELTMTARLPNGATLYGGWTTARDVAVTCDSDDPNTFRFCDERGLIPFRHDFKMSGGYPLPWDIQLGFSFQSYAGATSAGRSNEGDGSLSVNWNIPASLFPGGRTQTVVVPLIPPGTKYPDRHNQLDFSVKRIIRVGRTEVHPTLSLYNALNGNNVFNEVEDFGPALGRPDEILQGRLMQLAVHVKF